MALRFGGGTAPFLIAGPCVVESDDLNVRIGEALAELGVKLGISVIYKASYDKANRSGLNAARGPGLEAGLRALEQVRAATGLPILTDVHEPGHVPAAARVADVLQIPAFLCRQTDLLVAAGKAGRPVNIKKGQWMAPEEMRGAVDKVRGGRRRRRWLFPRDASRPGTRPLRRPQHGAARPAARHRRHRPRRVAAHAGGRACLRPRSPAASGSSGSTWTASSPTGASTSGRWATARSSSNGST